jgi:hypothetical protein
MKSPEKPTSGESKACEAVQRLETMVKPHGWRHGLTCQGTKKDGRPCGAGATLASGGTRCFFHSENVPEEVKRAAVVKGGLMATRQFALPQAPDLALSTPEEITAAATETANRVQRGELAPSIAMALSSLFGVALRSFEMSVARRLAEMESALASRARPVGGFLVESEARRLEAGA